MIDKQEEEEEVEMMTALSLHLLLGPEYLKAKRWHYKSSLDETWNCCAVMSVSGAQLGFISSEKCLSLKTLGLLDLTGSLPDWNEWHL